MKAVFTLATVLLLAGCAPLTEDAMTPVALSFSDGSEGGLPANQQTRCMERGNTNDCIYSQV